MKPMSDEQELTPQENQEDTSTELMVQLNPKIQRFVHLYLTGHYTISKLAQLLEVHPNTIHGWMRKPEVKEVIYEMQTLTHEMVHTQLKALTHQAIGKLAQLMNSPIDGVALQAVKDVLDRAGHKQKQEIKIDKTVTTVEQRLQQLIDESIDLSEEEYEIIEADTDEN